MGVVQRNRVMCNLDATSVNQNAEAPVSRYLQGQPCGMIDTCFVAALSAAMGNQGIKWDPTKINFFVLMTLFGRWADCIDRLQTSRAVHCGMPAPARQRRYLERLLEPAVAGEALD